MRRVFVVLLGISLILFIFKINWIWIAIRIDEILVSSRCLASVESLWIKSVERCLLDDSVLRDTKGIELLN